MVAHDAPRPVLAFREAGMGRSDQPDLPGTLAEKLFGLLAEADLRPAEICFYTEGVRVCCEGSPMLPALKSLEQRGVALILCSTCFETLGLGAQLRVGVRGGMGDILEAMWRADKVLFL